MRDITIFHGGHFAVLVTGCDNLTVDNVTMDTDRDGIDIDCCRNTMVSNCRINSPRDDGLCPKSTFALGRNVITENLTIVNCQVSGFQEGTLLDGTMKPARGTGRIKFGTESNGGFRNVTIANCTFRGCHGLALEEVDGGIMENITINNLTMMDVVGYPIYITTGERNRGPDVTTPGRMRNIFISNVIATGVDPMSGIQITGIPGQPIEGVRLENIRLEFKGGGTRTQAARVPPELGTGYPEPGRLGVMPAYGLFARHVRDLELANVNLSFAKLETAPGNDLHRMWMGWKSTISRPSIYVPGRRPNSSPSKIWWSGIRRSSTVSSRNKKLADTGTRGRASRLCHGSSLPDAQSDVDLIDGFADVFADTGLGPDFGCTQHGFEHSPGFTQFVVRQNLLLSVFGFTNKVHAQQFGGGLDLVHGLHAMAFVIVVAGGQDEIGTGQCLGFRERHGLELIGTGKGVGQGLWRCRCGSPKVDATGQDGD